MKLLWCAIKWLVISGSRRFRKQRRSARRTVIVRVAGVLSGSTRSVKYVVRAVAVIRRSTGTAMYFMVAASEYPVTFSAQMSNCSCRPAARSRAGVHAFPVRGYRQFDAGAGKIVRPAGDRHRGAFPDMPFLPGAVVVERGV